MDNFYVADTLESDENQTYEPSIHSDDEPDDCANDLLDDKVTEPSLPSVPPSLRRQKTAELRSKIPTTSLLPAVLATSELWASLGIDLPIFLDALSWGDLACRQNRALPSILTPLQPMMYAESECHGCQQIQY
ncbi:hypothetical protein BDN71DRAFT_1506643 [Pleurotus eryngii]|uniref:Uncharacterized protein n=1 Tax=Pleurotus eryngii TaxID=5323 RepID=A0A9P6DGS5_PLEER|nr:hypothetical protein BDN71DRAFT_1506643 [Pleurotus eryngii]